MATAAAARMRELGAEARREIIHLGPRAAHLDSIAQWIMARA
jgi:hypothetical protein